MADSSDWNASDALPSPEDAGDEVEASGPNWQHAGSLSLESVQAVIAGCVQHAVAQVAAGLAGLESGADPTLVPGLQVHIKVQGNAPPVGDLRATILASGFQTCADCLGSALVWAFRETMLWTQPGTVIQRDDGGFSLEAETDGATWNEKIVTGGTKFEAMDLPTKLKRLEGLGVVLPALTNGILSLNAARNCLVHRAGIVSPRDLTSDEEMSIRWWKVAIRTERDGKANVVGVGSRLEAGTSLSVEIEEAGRTFALGERIVLTADDFQELATTYIFFGQQLSAEILNLQRRRFESGS